MIQKKVCMVGAFAVGKSSLVQRFVKSIFSDRYLTTVGVKIDKKSMMVDGGELTLVLWDLAGEDEFQTVQLSYLRGAAGYLLVVDGTRTSTLDTAELIRRRVADEVGELPFVLVVNKADLSGEWEIEDETLAELAARGVDILRASAKTGDGVEEAFTRLARKVTA